MKHLNINISTGYIERKRITQRVSYWAVALNFSLLLLFSTNSTAQCVGGPTASTGGGEYCDGQPFTLTQSGLLSTPGQVDVWYAAVGEDNYTQEGCDEGFLELWNTFEYDDPNCYYKHHNAVYNTNNGILHTEAVDLTNGAGSLPDHRGDPFIWMYPLPGNVTFSADDYNYINVRYKVTNYVSHSTPAKPAKMGVLFTKRALPCGSSSDDYGSGFYPFSLTGQSGHLRQDIVADGNWHVISFPFHSLANWNGDITGLRFDFFDPQPHDDCNGSTMETDFITVSKHPMIAQGSTVNINPGDAYYPDAGTSTTFYAKRINDCGGTTCRSETVTIKPLTYGIDTQIACDTYTWIDGNVYTQDNSTAQTTITGSNGCDSTVTLNLTINYSETSNEIQTSCDSYTWPTNGQTYTSSGTYSTILQTQDGCDSTVTLDLTINNSYATTQTEAACNLYTWPANGQTYTNSGTYTANLQSQEGCDSIVTLNLTINSSHSTSQTEIACESYTWAADGQTYTASGTYTASLQSQEGCDSLVSLDLTISNKVFGTDTKVACDSYTWIDGVTYTSDNNTATHTLTAVNGCDSIVTLNLTISSTSSLDINFSNIQHLDCFDGNNGAAEAMASGGIAPYTYHWVQTNHTAPNIEHLSAGSHTVEITDSAGCSTSQSVTITQPEAIKTVPTIKNANCGEKNGSIALSTSGGTGNYTYQWQPSGINAQLLGLYSGNYGVTITDENGCTLNTSFMVGTMGSINFSIYPDEAKIRKGDNVNLTVFADNNINDISYEWSPAEGLSCANCPNPVASPEETTTYAVTLTTPDGCSTSGNITIRVTESCPELFIPGKFSPNIDGKNDDFCVYGGCKGEFLLTIFDRWGNTVYQSNSQNECWDGKSNGKALNSGVYIYRLVTEGENGEELIETGNINLIR